MRDFDHPPEDLTAWLRAGLRRVEAVQWRRWRFTLEEAQAWRASGVMVALTAAQWRTAAVTPGTVDQWRAARIGPGEAVRFHEFGVDLPRAARIKASGGGPESVFPRSQPPQILRGPYQHGDTQTAWRRFHEAGVPGPVMQGYITSQWWDDKALAWARHGISAEHARIWASLALRPAEAAELAEAGRTPEDVIAEWWRAGIPFDEAADWIGAGLTAAEAVEQRAAGVTVEQAAALRALRNPKNE
ncbi:MAG TPA: hypothetical protein VFO16_19615 [Pseudonocardiaceae bacterium]|nr:hypothetical protein [Pseudonocardiaceae bacterium]